MDYTADFINVHDYKGKNSLSSSGKYALVCRITASLLVCIGLIGLLNWNEQQAGSVNLEADVANELMMRRTDPQYVAEAKVLAEALSKAIALEDDVTAQAMRIAKPIEELMADPKFVEDANEVALQFKAVMDDPIVQKEAELYSEKMKTIVASLSAEETGLQGRRLSSPSQVGQISRPLVKNGPPTFALRRAVAAKRDVSMNAQSKSLNVLTKLGEKRVATTISEAGLLTAAESAGVFTQLEKAGAFSQAEKLLPLVDNLGLLDFLQDSLDTPSGVTFAKGASLVALGPIYVALVNQGVLPAFDGPAAYAPGVLFAGTTGAGALLIVLSNLIGQLQSESKSK